MTDTAGITVAGRTFRPVTSRSDGKIIGDQYNYLMAAIWSSDVAGADNMREVFFRVASAGKLGAVLAGLYVEEAHGQAEPWTAESANKLAQFFGGPLALADVLAVQAAVIKELPSFFPGVRGYSVTSPPASAAPETPASISETPTNPATSSATSAPTSDSSPETTPMSSPVLAAGA